MFSKKRYGILSILIIMFGLLLIGGTYAYLTILLEISNASYVSNTTCFNIDYDITNDNGTLPISGILFQSSIPKGGVSGKVALSVDSECGVDGIGKLILHINDTTSSKFFNIARSRCEDSNTLKTVVSAVTLNDCNLRGNSVWVNNSSALKYAVYEKDGDNPVSVGHVNGAGEIILYENFELSVSKGIQEYYIYLWLDGELADSSYSSLNFDGYIYATAVQVE